MGSGSALIVLIWTQNPLSFFEDNFAKAGSSRAPQCNGQISGGAFSQKLIECDGVTTALLKRDGIRAIVVYMPKYSCILHWEAI